MSDHEPCNAPAIVVQLERRMGLIEQDHARLRADVDDVRSTHLEHSSRIAGELTRIYKMLARIDRKLGGRGK